MWQFTDIVPSDHNEYYHHIRHFVVLQRLQCTLDFFGCRFWAGTYKASVLDSMYIFISFDSSATLLLLFICSVPIYKYFDALSSIWSFSIFSLIALDAVGFSVKLRPIWRDLCPFVDPAVRETNQSNLHIFATRLRIVGRHYGRHQIQPYARWPG